MGNVDIKKLWIETIKEAGNECLINTPECVIYKSEHKNCIGCSSNLGCSKLAGILLTISLDFEDSLKTTKKTADIILSLIEAKTNKEVDNLL